MPTIIVSYRREDTAWIAGRIHDRLRGHYGAENVFMDIDSIPFGFDFREHIQDTLERCDILLAIIGPRWVGSDEAGRARIHDESDWVRIEIEAALAKRMPVIPVLIDGAKLPPPSGLPDSLRDIVFRQAADVDAGRDFHPHMDRLIRATDRLLAVPKPARPKPRPATTSQPTTSGGTGLQTRISELHVPSLGSPPLNLLPSDEKAATAFVTGKVLVYFFASLDGRLNRAKYWAGILILGVLSLIAGFIIGAMFGPTTLGAILVRLVTLALFYPGYAVAAKRFQDRDKPGVTALYGLVPVLIASLLQAFGLTGTPKEPNALGWISNLVTMGVGIWFLIELGILKGTPGSNRFGPDSLTGGPEG